MKKVIDWFLSLSLREQSILALGAVLLGILLLYGLLFAPITSRVQQSQQAVADRQSLLLYAHRVKNQILVSRHHAHGGKPEPVSNVMAVVEHALAQEDLAKYLQKVQQPDAQTVAITLHAVPFDLFIRWLQGFVRRYDIKIIQFQAKKASAYGVVDLQFLCKG